ncbi:MAG: flagellar biosynthetic protein FliQ [Rhizobiales bacterium]|nr:flagellar biosynthetic protein FliQ [Hyphomicrobiales bacterium]MBI3672778.1 flagellar biosynthetic protein FliQ [Hyphomicrobiales bacterium]
MNETDAMEIVQAALWTVVLGSGPAVGAAMVVGILIALLQALTQVQEATLTFVPKILVIFAVMVMTGPFIASQLYAYTELVYSRIATGF